MTIRLFEVGGAVRDELMGLKSKDVDFAVEAPSFDAMLDHIENTLKLKVFLVKREFLTVRAGVPEGHKLRERCKDADFVLCRKDGPTKDGRRPEFVEPGSIFDDLARRDFTVNAIARCVETGELLDPHRGRDDLNARRLAFVGNAMDRIREDGLRVLRAFRFSVTKGLDIDAGPLWSLEAAEMLKAVSVERIREELEKMFAHDTLASLHMLERAPLVREAVFSRPGLRLSATLRK